jgi:hypothetical protein
MQMVEINIIKRPHTHYVRELPASPYLDQHYTYTMKRSKAFKIDGDRMPARPRPWICRSVRGHRNLVPVHTKHPAVPPWALSPSSI